ncbi:hypothetical protein LUQ84_000710 [Hamiltosporidium tvaerminnensis]|nr:hypothetical protein LUQ84_000710 [Hamiltosporidium tvaerminnensis]
MFERSSSLRFEKYLMFKKLSTNIDDESVFKLVILSSTDFKNLNRKLNRFRLHFFKIKVVIFGSCNILVFTESLKTFSDKSSNSKLSSFNKDNIFRKPLLTPQQINLSDIIFFIKPKVIKRDASTLKLVRLRDCIAGVLNSLVNFSKSYLKFREFNDKNFRLL